MECLHAMRTLAMVLLEDPDYPLDVWSSFYRAVNQGLAHCGCPGQFLVLPKQMRDEREPESGSGVAGADDHRVPPRCRPLCDPGRRKHNGHPSVPVVADGAKDGAAAPMVVTRTIAKSL